MPDADIGGRERVRGTGGRPIICIEAQQVVGIDPANAAYAGFHDGGAAGSDGRTRRVSDYSECYITGGAA